MLAQIYMDWNDFWCKKLLIRKKIVIKKHINGWYLEGSISCYLKLVFIIDPCWKNIFVVLKRSSSPFKQVLISSLIIFLIYFEEYLHKEMVNHRLLLIQSFLLLCFFAFFVVKFIFEKCIVTRYNWIISLIHLNIYLYSYIFLLYLF